MSRFVRGVVALSAALALLTISFLAFGSSGLLRLWLVSWVALFIVGKRPKSLAIALPLVAAYLTPAAFMFAIGRNATTFGTLWMGGLLAVILRTSWRSDWSLPARWRWPLMTTGLVIAVSWPLVGWRELDFTLSNIWNDRLPVAGVKLSGIAVAGGAALAASIQLLGILFVDWLWANYSSDRARFRHNVVVPLALGMVVSCALGMYQGFVDVTFLSGHVWPSMQRAAGTLMDANVFGMLAALWAPAFLVLALSSRTQGAAGYLLCCVLAWAGVWVSGSRTAMLAAVLGLVIAVASVARGVISTARGRRFVVGVAASVLCVVIGLTVLPRQTKTAFERARYLVPSLSIDSIGYTAHQLWTRDGYGTTADAMIGEYPLFGVGIGCFTALVHDFGLEHGLNIPPENAQNWFRHQLAELGLLGSVGWIGWTWVLIAALWPANQQSREPGIALRGPLVAFGLVSLVGMPGYEPAVAITFWLLVFWYANDAGFGSEPRPGTGRLGWVTMWALVIVYAISLAIPNDLRTPYRAARFNFPYTYGMDFEHNNQVWTGKHGVTVLNASQEWLKLTVWVNHPDADKQPVNVDVWKDHEHIINEGVRFGRPVTRYVRVGQGARFVLESKVDRTFRPTESGSSPDSRDLGLAMAWEFVAAPPR